MSNHDRTTEDSGRSPIDAPPESRLHFEPHEHDPHQGDMTVLGVVLAAGSGSRYSGGGHKLVSEISGRAVIAWAVHHCLSARFDEVVVIEGAVPLAEVVPPEVSLVHNHDWHRGQSTSLQTAVHYAGLVGHGAVVVGLGDQPLIPPEAWRRVAASESPVAVAQFNHLTTPPVRLHADVWPLLPLSGDEGARQLIRSHPELVAEIPCPGSPIDVDTEADLMRLQRDPISHKLGELH